MWGHAFVMAHLDCGDGKTCWSGPCYLYMSGPTIVGVGESFILLNEVYFVIRTESSDVDDSDVDEDEQYSLAIARQIVMQRIFLSVILSKALHHRNATTILGIWAMQAIDIGHANASEQTANTEAS